MERGCEDTFLYIVSAGTYQLRVCNRLDIMFYIESGKRDTVTSYCRREKNNLDRTDCWRERGFCTALTELFICELCN